MWDGSVAMVVMKQTTLPRINCIASSVRDSHDILLLLSPKISSTLFTGCHVSIWGRETTGKKNKKQHAFIFCKISLAVFSSI